MRVMVFDNRHIELLSANIDSFDQFKEITNEKKGYSDLAKILNGKNMS